ncbi:MAG: OmpA family protein [Bacteroidota bacterium]|nr:OmpA family protein [Bacteroidota bacterium]
MKTSFRFFKCMILAIILIVVCQYSQAQFLKRLKNKITQTAADHVTNDAGNATDKAIDKTEDAAKGDKSNNAEAGSSSDPNSSGSSSGDATASSEKNSPPTIQSYKNYDFVPGDDIIFESDLADEQTGEIPSQFTLSDGQVDVQQEDGENVIHVPTGPGATFTPRMTKETYMPDQFTVEFDFKNEKFGLNHFSVDFGNRVYYAQDPAIMPGVSFTNSDVTWTLGDVEFPKDLHADGDYPMVWHHIAIAINKNVGKVYVDQYRVANVNNLTGKPNNVTIHVSGYENSFVKNIRIAKGGINIYKETTTPSKIIMHGILFDVDKATLKPESMGSINEIYNLMKKNASLKFEIDGHTDNTGDASHNLTLSQQRADAVKTQLVSMGIDASRLTTKGFGDTKPIAGNDTPEGKANNRRVEFIKM